METKKNYEDKQIRTNLDDLTYSEEENLNKNKSNKNKKETNKSVSLMEVNYDKKLPINISKQNN